MDKVPKQKIVLVNFPRTLVSLLDLSTLETGANRLSWNVAVELPFCAAWYFRRAQTSRDLAMQALVWLCTAQFRVIWFGVVRFSISYENL